MTDNNNKQWGVFFSKNNEDLLLDGPFEDHLDALERSHQIWEQEEIPAVVKEI